jgi:hypothetical protein
MIPEFPTLVSGGLERLEARVAEVAPGLDAPFSVWIRQRTDGPTPDCYFTHPEAFPLLLLPLWLDESLDGRVDLELELELVYASSAMYYLIRLIDDVMDDNDATARSLLPLVAVLHAEFHGTYHALFPAEHPFIEQLHRIWGASQAAAYRDSVLEDVTAESFASISARKVLAATIPMLAVAHRHGLEALPVTFEELFEAHGAWHQFHNDLFDWKRDLDAGRMTYLLAEARRKRGERSVVAWVASEGFGWGLERLDGWMARMKHAASEIRSPYLDRYLAEREARFARRAEAARAGLAVVSRLLASVA